MDHTCDYKAFGWCSKCTRWVVMAVGILLSLFLLAKAIHEFRLVALAGREISPATVISVSGTGEAVAIPDTAEFTYSVVESAKTVPDAQKLASDKANKTIDFLASNGIDKNDVKTLSYDINPKYEYQQGALCPNFGCPPGKQILTGYEVSQTVSVKVKKTDDAGKVLSGIGALGVSNVSGLSFTVENEDAVKSEARGKAINDAKAKAAELAKELGVKLVRVVNFSENGMPMPIMYNKAAGMSADMSFQAAAPELPPGQNTVTSNVTVTYEIKG